jgi:hypothetical protein
MRVSRRGVPLGYHCVLDLFCDTGGRTRYAGEHERGPGEGGVAKISRGVNEYAAVAPSYLQDCSGSNAPDSGIEPSKSTRVDGLDPARLITLDSMSSSSNS